MPVDPATNTSSQARKKKQLTVVALLLVGLLIAIVTQPSNEQPASAPTAIVKMLPSADASPTRNESDAPRPEFTATRELSRVELKQMLQTKLFVTPESEQNLEADEEVKQPTEVTVQAIYGSGTLTTTTAPTQHHALIGQAIIRTGEVLPDGRQIVRVTPDGVELAQ